MSGLCAEKPRGVSKDCLRLLLDFRIFGFRGLGSVGDVDPWRVYFFTDIGGFQKTVQVSGPWLAKMLASFGIWTVRVFSLRNFVRGRVRSWWIQDAIVLDLRGLYPPPLFERSFHGILINVYRSLMKKPWSYIPQMLGFISRPPNKDPRFLNQVPT